MTPQPDRSWGDVHRRLVSRRQLIVGSLGLGLMATLAACGSDDAEPTSTPNAASEDRETPADSGAAEPTATSDAATATESDTAGATGEWEFTDDRGITVTLPTRPTRIVAYSTVAASLWDYGIRPVGIVGPQRKADGSQDPQTGDIDLDLVESIGEEADALDLEKLVTLEADLIIGLTYDLETIWPLDAGVAAQMEAIAPMLGMSATGESAKVLIERFQGLAEALGADLDAPEVSDGIERFEQASAELSAAIEEKPGLTVMTVTGGADQLYVGNPNQSPDLIYFSELGLDLIEPDDSEGFIFATLSWEQALKYQADLVLNDARETWYSKEELAAQPTWQEQPAQKADQIGDWEVVFVMSHKGFAEIIEHLTETIQQSRADVVQE